MSKSAVELVLAELARATAKFGPFHSAHEGWAVLREEVDELWWEVKANDRDRQRAEAVQVAAMALRFLRDCSGVEVSADEFEFGALLSEVERLRARVAELEARVPVVCETCDGQGFVHQGRDGSSAPAVWDGPHESSKDAYMVPCAECVRCPDCGHGDCMLGVRWA